MIVAIYDGGCRLCTQFATILRKAVPPRELDIVPCGSPIQAKIAPQVPLSVCRRAFTVVEEDGSILTGSRAAGRALALAPQLKSYAWMIERGPGQWLARIAYSAVTLWRRGTCRTCGKE